MSGYAWTDPYSDVVLLRGGPRPHRGFFYADWLATRAASRRMRCPLGDYGGWSRRYAPTTDTHTDEHGRTTRVWEHIDPGQWGRWGREYLTPDEELPAARFRTGRAA
ncbi:hypothetical protein [Actinokineospora iranica]|uniref:Uncharacterized protein n=1 Tax=Actinokineospora iranica TaxID=1271860 RepID=A0A1G6WQC1_9PSEU|nr:hypothetical protein [Actinokineospora iranica]SDD68072.1 hypothetical protein SAMN05216174_115124 [Actinokineospora iranica]